MNMYSVETDEFAALRTAAAECPQRRVALGKSGDDVFRCEKFSPLIVFGPQRSGKTTGVVIPALLEWDGPCLVTSVRLDVVEDTLGRRRDLGQTFIFDPAGLVEASQPGFVEHCVGWSPLDGIVSWDDAVRRSFGLAEGAQKLGAGVENGQFWASQARMLLAPLLFAAARTGGRMSDVLDWIGIPATEIVDELAVRFANSDSVESAMAYSPDWIRCVRRLSAFESYADNTYSSVCATAGTMLEVFSYAEVEQRCGSGGLTLDAFLDGGAHTLYMCAPPDDQELYKPLFTALVREVLRLAYERNKSGRKEDRVPLMLCLDEAGNVARLDNLHVIATTAAGTEIQLVSVFHDVSQLFASYDRMLGQLIINNHSGKLFLPGNSDPETTSFLVSTLVASQVRGLEHTGWTHANLRELPATQALCVYGQMPPILLETRRSYEDERLRRLATGRGPDGQPE